MRVAANEEIVAFPVSWPAGQEDLHLMWVKVPTTEVALVTPGCHVVGANIYRDRVRGSSTPDGCDLRLSKAGKEDEGLYEMRNAKINGTAIPDSRIRLIFEDQPHSGGSKTAGNNKLLTCGAVFLAACLPFLL